MFKMAGIPRVGFNNGHSCPIVGLGTWLSKPNEVKEAVKTAIDCGYRHIDCAYAYMNEDEVGDAIAEKIKDGTVTREEIFITSKLPITFLRPDLVSEAAKQSLKKLKLDYLDLYLIHGPTALKPGDELFPVDENGKLMFADVDYLDTWKAMEALVDQGLVKSIGVSNFSIYQLNRVVSNARIIPVNNQIEIHPYRSEKSMIEYCRSKKITLTAYTPLGNPSRPIKSPNDPHLLSDPIVVAIAEKKGKTPAQILIRYHVENGTIVIPKSLNKSRIESNFQVFNFTLTADDKQQLEGLNRNYRFLLSSGMMDHPHYPYKDDATLRMLSINN